MGADTSDGTAYRSGNRAEKMVQKNSTYTWERCNNRPVSYTHLDVYKRQTVTIAVGKIIGNIIFPLIFALLLNELALKRLKRPIQTIVYLPYLSLIHISSGVESANTFNSL